MSRTFAIVGVTTGPIAIPTAYLLKECSVYALSHSVPLPAIVIEHLSTLENKSTAYSDKLQSERIVNTLGDAIEKMMFLRPEKVSILCNVAHLYVEPLLKAFPDLQSVFCDILHAAVVCAKETNIERIMVFCSENARKSRLFDYYFSKEKISVDYALEHQDAIHSLMDCAENMFVTDAMVSSLYELCSAYRHHSIFLACTELSMIYGHRRKQFSEFTIIDTIDCAIAKMFSE